MIHPGTGANPAPGLPRRRAAGGPPFGPGAAPPAAARRRPSRVTVHGVTLFVVSLLTAASAVRELRVEVAGLLVHPYLIPMAFLGLAAGLRRLPHFPKGILEPLVAFAALYCLATLPAGGHLGETLKMVAAVGTVVIAAVVVRGRADFRTAVLGLALAAAALSLRGLAGGTDVVTGINPLEEVANKNAFSLYVLPAILLGSFIALDRSVSRWLRLVLAGCTVVTAVAVFSTANRSGWLGVLLIAVMLYGRRGRLRTTVAVALLAGATYYGLTRFSSTSALEYRWELTFSGYSSDELRQDLFTTALEIGFEHPLLGVTPQRLPAELARRVGYIFPEIDPHNVVGQIVGGCGLVVFAVFCWLGWALWRRPPWFARMPAGSRTRSAHNLLRMMAVLWIVRGLFSREVLYAPGFAIGLGLVLGLCIVEGVWRRPPLPAAAPGARNFRRREMPPATAAARPAP